MLVLGLTGSIGMGKSTAASALRDMDLPVHDADGMVHELMAKGGSAVDAIETAFPGVVTDGAVDRERLGARVFEDRAALKRLEDILHPLVRESTRDFLDLQSGAGQPLVVLDIPLLYETGGEALCDAVVVVSAPSSVQHDRVMGRPGMTAARFRAILDKQMPDQEKRRRADFVIDTGLSKANSLRQLRAAITLLREHPERYRRERVT